MKIFLSSTCYDLADLRATLVDYLEKSGHQVLLSDRSNFPVDPGQHRHNVCVDNAANSEFMIVIVDSRFGALYVEDNSISVTWAETRAALAANVKILVFVRHVIFMERLTWKQNPSITPVHCDDTRVFQFIDELQTHPSGIWMDTKFDNVMDIINRLRNIRFGETIKPSNKTDTTLSITSIDFVKSIYSDFDGKRSLNDSEIARCIKVLKSFNGGYAGILFDNELTKNRWWMFYPIRPAEDDGSSWHAARQLTAEGHVALNELLAYQKNIRSAI